MSAWGRWLAAAAATGWRQGSLPSSMELSWARSGNLEDLLMALMKVTDSLLSSFLMFVGTSVANGLERREIEEKGVVVGDERGEGRGVGWAGGCLNLRQE